MNPRRIGQHATLQPIDPAAPLAKRGSSNSTCMSQVLRDSNSQIRSLLVRSYLRPRHIHHKTYDIRIISNCNPGHAWPYRTNCSSTPHCLASLSPYGTPSNQRATCIHQYSISNHETTSSLTFPSIHPGISFWPVHIKTYTHRSLTALDLSYSAPTIEPGKQRNEAACVLGPGDG